MLITPERNADAGSASHFERTKLELNPDCAAAEKYSSLGAAE
jgi:hypothetical protein